MSLSLHRLLDRGQVVVIIERFQQLFPDGVLALVERDGDVLVGTCPLSGGAWGEALEKAGAGAWVHGPTWTLAPLRVGDDVAGVLAAGGEIGAHERECLLEAVCPCLEAILVESVEKRAIARETLERYREINLLYNIGETIGASLDPEAIPQLVLAEANRVIRSDAELVAVMEPVEGEAVAVHATFGDPLAVSALTSLVAATVGLVRRSGQPAILTEFLTPPLSALLCAPLKTQDRTLGAILLGRMGQAPVFTAGEEKLLMALAGQAAIAMENARLFADVKRQRDAIAAMKNYMDNIFASIASGVITTNVQNQITTLNRAAEEMLVVRAREAMGRHYADALPDLGREIAALVERVRQQERQVVGYELEPWLPQRGQVVLRLHISPLKDSQKGTNGVAIVLDDLTEQRSLEEQVQQVRHTFERYVAPQVVEQILSDPVSVQLGGVRQELTTLFADIRGFTTFSEQVEPEVQIEVLNRHLNLAAGAVLAEEGTLDKFMGDAVMAIFNAPLAQPDHVLRAVRAALAMQQAVTWMHANTPRGEQLSFGVGITTGPAVVGNIGSTTIQNYTAIGDCVNMAQRLQTHARPGQILLNAPAYRMVREQVEGRELGHVHLKGHSEPDLVFEVVGLR